MRRHPIRWLMATLACLAGAMILAAPSASAADDWGTTWGFTYYPLNTQDHCGNWDNPLVFEFDAYKRSASAITIEWRVIHHGTMAIRIWNTTGPITGIHYFDSNVLSGSRVYFWRVSGINVATADVHLTWSPTSGGSCFDQTRIVH